MKRNSAIFLLLMCSAIAFAQKKDKIKGNKLVTEITRILPQEFNALELDDNIDITISQGNQNSYHLAVDDNLVDIIKFEVRDSILKISTTHDITAMKKMEIDLVVSELEHIILKNNTKIKSNGRLNSEKVYLSSYNDARFDLDLKADDITVTMHRNAGGKLSLKSENTTVVMNDRTDLKADIQCEKIRVTLNNSAQFNVDGSADYAAFNLKGSAELDAKRMKVSTVDLYTTNNSDVNVHARRNLEVYAQGKSNVFVYGDPNIEIKGLTDKSKIIKK